MTKLECESGGGLVLIDRDTLDKWKAQDPMENPDYAGLLGIVVDYEGRTDQVTRWSNEDWRDVWKRESTVLVDKANAGDFAGFVFRPGSYYCDLDLDEHHADSATSRKFEQWLFVPSGHLIIADLGKLAEDWEVAFPIEHNSFTTAEVSVLKGWHKVTFLFHENIISEGVGRQRVYGSTINPVCVVRIEQSSEVNNAMKHLPVYPDPHRTVI